MTPTATLRQCIRRCARAKDGRGPWQAERSCANALARTGNPSIAANCAAAARRLGEWLKGARNVGGLIVCESRVEAPVDDEPAFTFRGE